MALKINESIFLNEILASEKYQNSSLIGRIDILNHVRTSRAFYGWGHVFIKKIIEDAPSKRIDFLNLHWKQHSSLDISLFKDTLGNYIIEYPTESGSVTDPENISGACSPLGSGPLRICRKIENFSNFTNRGFQNNENLKFFRYLRAMYNEAWLELKRNVVKELKKSVDRNSITEYYDAKKADKTVAIMAMAKSINSLLNSIEGYRDSMAGASAESAHNAFTAIEKNFFTFRAEHNRIDWNALHPRKRIPGGKKVLEALLELEEKV